MVAVKKYSLKDKKYFDFAEEYRRFGMAPVSDNLLVARQFIDLMNWTILKMNVDNFTFTCGKNGYAIYADRVQLAKICDGRLIKLLVPGIVKQDAQFTDFLGSTGVEYVVTAGFPDMVHAGSDFLKYAYDLKHLYIPKVQDFGQDGLRHAQIERLEMQSVVNTGKGFLQDNDTLTSIDAPRWRSMGDKTLYSNAILDPDNVNAPKLIEVGSLCSDVFYEIMRQNQRKQK